MHTCHATEAFIGKWSGVAASELSTSQSFLIDLCALLHVDMPHATAEQDYMFERPITFRHGDGSTSAGRIDLYRRGAFVLESKKLKAGTHTKGFDEGLLRARSQAEAYARALPADEGRPPFVVVVDVGNRIELYSEFSRSGATYVPFPDPGSYRIAIGDLRNPQIRERLRQVWVEPLALDPSRESARVTREIAARLAELAKSLEVAKHPPELVAQFLMRCLFTMFAEDVRLLPADSFRDLLAKHAGKPDVAMLMLGQLWREMDAGGFSAVLADKVLRFNGKLFKDPSTLPLDTTQIGLLLDAAKADWKHVEPAIFGTLLERALSPQDRHKLGAHYTPRAYVERLVLPTVIEPLRAEWADAQAAAGVLAAEGKADEAVAELLKYHHRLCTVRVLDPACGTGNFLYVTLEHLKRLEGEVLNALDELGFRQTGLALGGERADSAAGETVDPHNLLGIEINPRAAAIAEVVLWIGYLQWHFRTRGDVTPPQPVIRDFRNIKTGDALLDFDHPESSTDASGKPVTRWDGRTMKSSAVTGEQIPDETARIVVERLVNPRPVVWQKADFIVGNPPFIGTRRMRLLLGDGYVDGLLTAYPSVPETVDFVMYWWHKAACALGEEGARRFGLITTNSITQIFNRAVVRSHLHAKEKVNIAFAVPDHPWVEESDGAAVRVAMTVGTKIDGNGLLYRASEVRDVHSERVPELELVGSGAIAEDLRVGHSPAAALQLRSNSKVSYWGVKFYGDGFILSKSEAEDLCMQDDGLSVARAFLSGRDLTSTPRQLLAIDCDGLTEPELASRYPATYQHLLDRVKPVRMQNPRPLKRDRWWIFGENQPGMRSAIRNTNQYIATTETAKHRLFHLVHSDVLAEGTVAVIALDSMELYGVLSSSVHETWALATGGTLEDRPRYNKTRCFETFPFPDVGMAIDGVRALIAALAQKIHAHRARQMSNFVGLTFTSVYNVLERLRADEALSASERVVHEQGLVSVLRQLHDDLDAAVLDAYGWSDLQPLLRIAHGNNPPAVGQTRADAKRAFEEAVVDRLVELNAERAAEETRGIVRWLRPEFQNSQTGAAATEAPEQAEINTGDEAVAEASLVGAPAKPQPWPKDPVAQVRAVADTIASSFVPLSVDDIAARFTARGPWRKRLPQVLDMLVALGRATEEKGKYLPR